jgi:hypothetical protein
MELFYSTKSCAVKDTQEAHSFHTLLSIMLCALPLAPAIEL